MTTFEELTKQITIEDLKSAYVDILAWRQTGVLKMESIIRTVQEQFNKENNTEYPIYLMENVILSEIAKRHYGF